MGIKSRKKGGKHDGINQIVADMYNVKPSYVSMVRNGERTGPATERILSAVMDLVEANHEAQNKLKEEVKRIVPLDAPSSKTKRQPVKYGELK